MKKVMWYSIVIIAVIGFVAFSAGFYQSIQLTSGSVNKAPTEVEAEVEEVTSVSKTEVTKKTDLIYMTIIGDSIARGTGDEKGKGFTEYLPEYLKNQTSKNFLVDNVAIDGLKSKGMLEQLQTGKLNNLIQNSDYIVVSIGGNDVRTIQNLDETAKDNRFTELQTQYLADLKECIKIIRKNSKEAMIIFVGLYNPYTKADSFTDNRLINTWNYNTQLMIESDSKAVFTPTYDMVKYNTSKYIAQDGLHPNSAGYKSISNRIVDSIGGVLNKK